jgi:hypothetical protein
MGIIAAAHDPSGPLGHLGAFGRWAAKTPTSFAGEERPSYSAAFTSGAGAPTPPRAKMASISAGL